MTKLFVLYDAQCAFSLYWRHWLGEQSTFLPLEFVPFQAPELVARFEGIESFRSDGQLLVVGDDRAVYQGPNAFIVLLFALRNYRELAYRLADPAFITVAAVCFHLLATGRKRFCKWLSSLGDSELLEFLRRQAAASGGS